MRVSSGSATARRAHDCSRTTRTSSSAACSAATTLARHFASGDLFVFPSLSETFGNVTLEALASGVPTVAFDYGAAREHLRDGVHGAAIGDGDEAGFIAACVRIAGDDLSRGAMRMATRQAVSRAASGTGRGRLRRVAARPGPVAARRRGHPDVPSSPPEQEAS